MGTPDRSDPHSLSPTMPSGTLYSSVIEVLQRETMKVSNGKGAKGLPGEKVPWPNASGL